MLPEVILDCVLLAITYLNVTLKLTAVLIYIHAALES